MTLFTAIKKWLHRMFGKTEEKTVQPVKTKKKLSRADKKQIEAAIARANRTDKKGKSAQDSIPYERMWPDGICRVSDSHYTKTIQFQDINYQLSQNEDKTAIFEGWCDFLNYFDSSIHFQLSFLNLAASEETFANSISIPPQRDAFDSIREEYTTMLQNQLARGNNGLIKTKYLTFGIDADSIKAAKPRLERIETDILNNFKRLGVAARTLDGKERLFQLHAVFHMDEQLPFQFEWDWLAPSGLSTKDFIAPSSFEFRTGKQFRMGKKYGAVSFLQILAPELNDRLLADFLDMTNYIIKPLGEMYMEEVTADDIRLALVPLSKKSEGLYNKVNMLLKCIFYTAERNKILEHNPCAGISGKGGKPTKKKESLTDQQVAVLLDTVKGLPPYLFIMLGLYSGLRREEILALQWDCVFLDETTPYLSVRRAWRTEHNRPVVSTVLKTPAAKRDIPIPKCLVDCLREAKENSISDYVIADSKGEPLAASQFQRVWQYVVVRSTKPRNYYKYVNGESIKYTVTPTLGMTQKNQPQIKYTLDFDVTPHQLRHTYITNLLYAGVDPKTVQYLAGHENSKTTMDIYAKVKYNKPEELFGVVNGAFHQAISE